MVQDKKFQSGKKPMSQDLDKKTQAGSSDRTERSSESSRESSRQGNMKQTDSKDRSGSKSGSRK